MANLTTPRLAATVIPPADAIASLPMDAAVSCPFGVAAGIIVGTGTVHQLVIGTSGETLAGICLGQADNGQKDADNTKAGAAAGDVRMAVQKKGLARFAATAPDCTWIKKPVYFTDDHTVTLTPGNVLAGVVAQLDYDELGNARTDSVLVDITGAVAAYSVGAIEAAVATTGSAASTGTVYGYTTAAQADALVTLTNAMRAALIAAGIMKGAA